MTGGLEFEKTSFCDLLESIYKTDKHILPIFALKNISTIKKIG